MNLLDLAAFVDQEAGVVHMSARDDLGLSSATDLEPYFLMKAILLFSGIVCKIDESN